MSSVNGSTKRRARAINRRAWVGEMADRHADIRDYEATRVPSNAIAVGICTCGRTSWLLPDATTEDRADFDRDNADHGCDYEDDE